MTAGDSADGVSVTRVGTQVVVRLSGTVDDAWAGRLEDALAEIESLVLRAVVVDFSEVDEISGAGLDFLRVAHERWRLRLLQAPRGLRGQLDRAS